MRFGFSLPNNQGVAHVSDLVDLACEAESQGFHSVWVSEHLFHASYVAERLGSAPYHEPITVLTAVAVETQQVRLGTSVLVLPWHQPVQLAKSIASLDDLSTGRVTLGVGVAMAKDEYANLGVDFSQRGKVANEMLAAMKALWCDELPEYDGELFQFQGLRFEPKPVQTPHPPILVGGASPAAFRRIALYGDGWHPLSPSVNEVSSGIEQIRAACRKIDRDPEPLKICPRLMVGFMDEPWDRPLEDRRTLRGTVTEIRSMLDAYERAGVDEVVLDANTADLDQALGLMDRIKNELMSG
ncbi:MAG: LLM class F420-dependent oxidoreductase [Pseudomonadales bacterium]|jgi:probable F420-dependent oxidoreductase|nr:LLM class F420-dependent oxidoreductase [Pseudomonadales bacterium]MDP7360306.1 LLM class F420-dependent oxidoreductase [Pseudomonadales bacterium]MDP7597582.1 LLM class F420-dependent oxidoreductase [Pseudomonadales bacterium]HJN50796.1 LLM class F420-dependent oxidoreductase [Pseudomonadales bacterium]|tara:strand:- start:51 stop:944 length:894 start_codon:yes stop_codon:yes gene_type:complete